MIENKGFIASFLFCTLFIISCVTDLNGTSIVQPDEYSHVYEAKEIVILNAIAGVFREKNIGANVRKDVKNMIIDSDFAVSGDWRTKAKAHVRKLNWKECEVSLSIITEKQTQSGWTMYRLLSKEQYETFFSWIELRIYEEMANIR